MRFSKISKSREAEPELDLASRMVPAIPGTYAVPLYPAGESHDAINRYIFRVMGWLPAKGIETIFGPNWDRIDADFYVNCIPVGVICGRIETKFQYGEKLHFKELDECICENQLMMPLNITDEVQYGIHTPKAGPETWAEVKEHIHKLLDNAQNSHD
ncbi:hypothetical protein EAN04_24680 [Salmonella enterica]|nr:hypothetical protein [Salmonella enterica]